VSDLAGNDEDAISYYERCLTHPPVHVGVLMNLGVLYEDSEKYDKAAECFRRVSHANPTDDHARLFLKDAQASQTMYYSPEEEHAVLSKPVSDLNLSVRARKCMNRLGINTLGDLVQHSGDELLESKNFGMTSLAEVREKLGQFGLTLRGD